MKNFLIVVPQFVYAGEFYNFPLGLGYISSYLKKKGFFDPEAVSRNWQEHKSGARNWQYELWDILMFNSWLEFNNI